MSHPSPRPLIHLTAESGWINDPLGLTYVDGTYHLFFQHVPGSTEWRPNCHWGHAVSDDLTTWRERGIALAPGEGDDGVWSGSIIQHPEHGPMLFYTSVTFPEFAVGSVRVATPVDGTWNEWSKGERVVTLPEELGATAFRDPFVFRDEGRWRMLVGTALAGGTAAAASFSSDDCLTWDFDGLAASRPRSETEPVWTGSLWECPQVFEIDGVDVLITSVWEDDVLHHVAYAVGRYEDGAFHAESWRRLTYGDSYYAPSFFRDADGDPCLIYWLRGPRDDAAGWASALSVPHRLRLVDGRLRSEPHATVLESIGSIRSASGSTVRVQTGDFRSGPFSAQLDTGESFTLRRTERGVEVRCGDDEPVICDSSADEFTVLVDGGICEVFLGDSVFAIG